MISLKKSKAGGVGTIHLEGDLDVEHCEKMKKVLLDAMDDTNKILINSEKLNSISLPCLQLLCSAHKSAIQLTKSFSLAGDRSQSFERALSETGFERHTACDRDLQESCPWLER